MDSFRLQNDHGFLIGSQSLTKTKEKLLGRVEEAVKQADAPAQRTRPVDVDTVEALEEALISADVGVEATERIVEAVRARDRRTVSLRELVKAEILEILRAAESRPGNGQRPHVVMIVGVNGTGKTTTVGKLARLIKDGGQAPLICAADTFRAAPWSSSRFGRKRADVDFIRARAGAIRRPWCSTRSRPASAQPTWCWSTRLAGCTRVNL